VTAAWLTYRDKEREIKLYIYREIKIYIIERGRER